MENASSSLSIAKRSSSVSMEKVSDFLPAAFRLGALSLLDGTDFLAASTREGVLPCAGFFAEAGGGALPCLPRAAAT